MKRNFCGNMIDDQPGGRTERITIAFAPGGRARHTGVLII